MVSLAFITRKFSLCSCILSNRNCIRLPPLLSTGNPIWWGWNTECNIAMPGEKIHSMSEHKIEPGFIGPNPKALLPMIGSLLPGNVLSTPYDRKSLTWQCTIYSLWSEVSYLAMYYLLPMIGSLLPGNVLSTSVSFCVCSFTMSSFWSSFFGADFASFVASFFLSAAPTFFHFAGFFSAVGVSLDGLAATVLRVAVVGVVLAVVGDEDSDAKIFSQICCERWTQTLESNWY